MAKVIKEYKISFYLDKRHQKKSGKYPVKLRVYSTKTQQRKLLPTKFEMTESEFSQTWVNSKTPAKYRDNKLKLQAIENHANDIAESFHVFNLEEFEKKFYGTLKSKGQPDINYYYNKLIEEYKKNNQDGTASSYECSLKSLMSFNKGKRLNFHTITPSWLKRYEHHMTVELGRSSTTVGVYLRTLRAIFNHALEDKTINKDIYPFGKRLYRIPHGKGVKNALTQNELIKLWNCNPKTKNQETAKDFWFFAYGCNGANLADIAMLKYRDLSGDKIKFVRRKSVRTVTETEPVVVFLNDLTKAILDKYKTKPEKPDNYIFPIIDPNADSGQNRINIQNFNRLISTNIKSLAKAADINPDISFNWSRHTFATMAIRKGASMEFVGAQMSHTNPKTTKRYFAGFEDEKKKELSSKLFGFIS